MSFDPDIVVTDNSLDVLLVVETKLDAKTATAYEPALISYMWRSRCPVGLLVDPSHIGIYRDSFTREDAQSIERVGRFDIPEIQTKGREVEFESAVQGWLEELRDKSEAEDWDESSWQAVSHYVLPALRSGEIRAAHPRYRFFL